MKPFVWKVFDFLSAVMIGISFLTLFAALLYALWFLFVSFDFLKVMAGGFMIWVSVVLNKALQGDKV